MKAKYKIKNYVLYCAQEANFQTRSILIDMAL